MRQAFIVAMVAAVCLGSCMVGWAGEPKKEDGIKVGTFDARTVSLAFGRSKTFNDYVTGVRAEHAKAKTAGDEKKMKEINEMMSRQQENAHRQVFGVGPYDSLVEQLKPVFGEVGKAEGVVVIVPKVYWAAEGVAAVDVTEAILKKLGTDEKTRKMIEEMNQKIRSGEFKPEEFKGEKD